MSSGLQWWHDQIGRIPLLTPTEEIELGHAVQAWRNHPGFPDGCPPGIRRRGIRARERFIQANLRLAVSWVSKRCNRLAKHGSIDDLIQAANEGVMKAVDRFDPTLGYRFSTYAYWWIRQAVNKWIDQHGRSVAIPASHCGLIAKMAVVSRDLVAALQRTPTRAELADALGVSERVLNELIINAKQVGSLDQQLDGDNDCSIGDMLAHDDLSLEEQEEQEEQRKRLEQLHGLIARLPKRQQRIIAATWGITGDALKVGQIAESEGITRRQVSDALDAAYAALRGAAMQLVLVTVPLRPMEPRPRMRRRCRHETVAVIQLELPIISPDKRRRKQGRSDTTAAPYPVGRYCASVCTQGLHGAVAVAPTPQANRKQCRHRGS